MDDAAAAEIAAAGKLELAAKGVYGGIHFIQEIVDGTFGGHQISDKKPLIEPRSVYDAAAKRLFARIAIRKNLDDEISATATTKAVGDRFRNADTEPFEKVLGTLPFQR